MGLQPDSASAEPCSCGSACRQIPHTPPPLRLYRIHLQVLSTPFCGPEDFAVLTSLGRLAYLSLDRPCYVSVCLPQLTSLVELKLEEVGLDMEAEEVQAAVEGALQQLTGVRTWAAAGWLAGRQTGCGQPLRTLMLAS